MTAGPPEIQSETRAASAPCRCDRPARGTRLSTSWTMSNARVRRGWTVLLLLALALLLFGTRPAHAGTGCDATYGGTLNGFVNPTPPTLLQIDGDCTIENFPASNPYGGSISWLSVSNTLLIFNNVDFVGNMSCDSQAHNDFVWFVNGSITRQHILKCSNLFAAVDKIDKQTPAGQTTAAIGVPFTYTLTFPQLYDPLSGRVISAGGSNRDVSQITITDNLNATGVSLSYLSSTATWKGSGAAVPFTVTNAGGLLTFSGFPTIQPDSRSCSKSRSCSTPPCRRTRPARSSSTRPTGR